VGRRRLPLSTLLAIAAALVTRGCAFRTPTPDVPTTIGGDGPGPADFRVADVAVTSPAGPVDPETTEAVRKQTRKILADTARHSHAGDGPTTVRVRVELGAYDNSMDRALAQDGCAMLGYAAYPAGATFEEQKLSVDLTLERAGHAFEGHGSADKDGSIYAPARKRALAVAIDRALTDAATGNGRR
jgi:hypothetical protein